MVNCRREKASQAQTTEPAGGPIFLPRRKPSPLAARLLEELSANGDERDVLRLSA